MSAQPRILNLFPPNYAAINRAFNVRGKPVIFAYGDRIYNPSRIVIPQQLIVHENVHLSRQAGDPASWWARYVTDPAFRLAEEVPAHAAEYRHIMEWRPSGAEKDRELARICERMASPLYGSLCDADTARRLIEHGEEGASREPLSHRPQ